nr:MAG TPA: hypothetical protein [Caudoviricetes sp.]
MLSRRRSLGGTYPLASQDLVSLKSIIIKNEITMDYINSWFDTMLDVLSDAVHYPARQIHLGSMIYDIAEKSKIEYGLFRYSYKESIIKFSINREDHEIALDLYLFDDVLPAADGCDRTVIHFILYNYTSFRNMWFAVKKNTYIYWNSVIPNKDAGIPKGEVFGIIVREIEDFLAAMLFTVIRGKPIQRESRTTSLPLKENTHKETKPHSSHSDNSPIIIDALDKATIRRNINASRVGEKHHEMRYRHIVHGYYRHYKDGRTVWVSSYVRCKNKGSKAEVIGGDVE